MGGSPFEAYSRGVGLAPGPARGLSVLGPGLGGRRHFGWARLVADPGDRGVEDQGAHQGGDRGEEEAGLHAASASG